MAKGGKMTSHPGFKAMVHHGPKHPGFKAAAAQDMQAPMPQPAPANTPMSGQMSTQAPPPPGMPPGGGGC